MADEKGIVGVALLWVLLAISLMAYSVMASARVERDQLRNQRRETQAIGLLNAGAVLSYQSNFQIPTGETVFETGRLRLERIPSTDEGTARVRMRAVCGPFEKEAVMTWKKSGSGWRAASWSEGI